VESVAVVLLLVLLGGYFVFAGSDIGLGMLLPYAARSPAERRRLIAVIAPYFLGSEVWLVATIGVVAGLVPVWEAAVVTAQWPVFVLLLAAWLGRDAGLWLRGRLPAARWRAVWDGAVAAGSWLLAVAWGFVVAALVGGGTLRPGVTLVCVALVVLLFAVRGAAFGAERLAAAEGVGGAEPGERAARASGCSCGPGWWWFRWRSACSGCRRGRRRRSWWPEPRWCLPQPRWTRVEGGRACCRRWAWPCCRWCSRSEPNCPRPLSSGTLCCCWSRRRARWFRSWLRARCGCTEFRAAR